jgi:hypothetical protein
MQNTHNFPSMGARSLALWPLSRAIKETSQSKRKKRNRGWWAPARRQLGDGRPSLLWRKSDRETDPPHSTTQHTGGPVPLPRRGSKAKAGGAKRVARADVEIDFSPLSPLCSRARGSGALAPLPRPLFSRHILSCLFARFRFSFSFSAFFSAWFSSQPGSRSAACDAVTGSARELRGSGHLAVTAKKKKTHGRLTCGPRCSSRPPPRGVVSSCRWLMTPAARLRDGFECVLPVLHTTPYLTNFFFQIANTFFFSNSIIFS